MIHRLASLIEFNLKGALADKAVVSPDEETEMITVNLEKFDCKYPILIRYVFKICRNSSGMANGDFL